jgi:hypothetical protein
MSKIKIADSVSRENLVEMIEMGAFAQVEAQLDVEPAEATVEIWELAGYVFCQVSTHPAPMRWSSMGTWTDGEEDLEEAKADAERLAGV